MGPDLYMLGIPGLNFTAIDFETANRFRRSACSLGLAVVRDGIIVETREWLIKPDPFEVEFYNQRVHGISIEMLQDQKTFGELWMEIHPYLHNQMIVAHNASFDVDVLLKLCDHYGLELTYANDFCTHTSIGYCWPEIGSSKLSDVARYLKIELNHHRAISDAQTAALIAIQMATLKGTADLATVIESRRGQNIAEVFESRKAEPRIFFQGRTIAEADLSILRFADSLSEVNWAGRRVCVTGTFDKFPDRAELVAKLVGLGAIKQSSVNSKTEIVIVGQGAGPSKVKEIAALSDRGVPILILNEDHISTLITD